MNDDGQRELRKTAEQDRQVSLLNNLECHVIPDFQKSGTINQVAFEYVGRGQETPDHIKYCTHTAFIPMCCALLLTFMPRLFCFILVYKLKNTRHCGTLT